MKQVFQALVLILGAGAISALILVACFSTEHGTRSSHAGWSAFFIVIIGFLTLSLLENIFDD